MSLRLEVVPLISIHLPTVLTNSVERLELPGDQSRSTGRIGPITQHKLPLFRAHGHLSRLSHIFMVQYRRREPASPTRFPSIRVQISTTGTRASCAIPVGHGPSSATGTHANSAVPLSRGINSAMGGRRFKRRPPQPWQGSLRFRRRSPRPRVAHQ